MVLLDDDLLPSFNNPGFGHVFIEKVAEDMEGEQLRGQPQDAANVRSLVDVVFGNRLDRLMVCVARITRLRGEALRQAILRMAMVMGGRERNWASGSNDEERESLLRWECACYCACVT